MNKVVIDTTINTEKVKKGVSDIKYSLMKLSSNIMTIGKLSKAAFQGMGNDLKYGASKMLNMKKAMNGMNMGFKQFLKFGLGIRSIFALINKIRGAISEGLGNLTKYDQETADSMNGLKASLGTLKNALGVAFAPILNAIAPALNYMIDLLIKAANAIGMFFAALTGKGSAVQAVKNNNALNKSLDKTGKNAKKAKNQLASFYDLNVINSEKDNGSGGGSTDAGGGFETTEIETKIGSLADLIKKAFADGDFTQIGAMVAEKIDNALSNIPWESIQEKLARIAKSIATFFNGIFGDESLFANIGYTVGQAINTIINTGLALVDNFDWKQAGKSLGIGINNWIKTVDWANIGKFFSDGIKGILDLLINLIETTDWKKLGESFRTTLDNIDWVGIIHRLAELIGSAFGGLVSFVWGILEESWNKMIAWFQENAFEDGKFSMTKLLDGVWEGIKNIGRWIKDNVFKPFSDGIKKAFGLDGGESMTEKVGKDLMATLLAGILVAKSTAIKGFELVKDGVLAVFSSMLTGVKGFVNNIISAIETMVNNVIKGLNTMINALNALSFDVPDWVPTIGGEKFGLNIGTIPEVHLPRLATGTVVPRQASEFAAILGDNNRETEVVSPLSTMKQALAEALAESGIGGETSINVYLEGDAKGLFRVVKAEADRQSMATGRPAFY